MAAEVVRFNDAQRRRIEREKGLKHAYAVRMFEVECLDGRASSPCVVNEEAVQCVERFASTSNGLTFETVSLAEEYKFASRLRSKTEEMLLPSTNFPSRRAAVEYRGFERVQVACYNGALWWNAVVIKHVPGRSEIFVALNKTGGSVDRPICVKLSSVRLKDWFRLHDNCRNAIYQAYLFLKRRLGHNMAKELSKLIWKTRDDREWDY